MRDLDPSVLATALPAAMRSLEDGTNVVAVSGRWLTAIHHRGRLRLLFFLPPEPEPAAFQRWLGIVKAWNRGEQSAESKSTGGIGRA